MPDRASFRLGLAWAAICFLLPLASWAGLAEETRKIYSNLIQILAPCVAAALCYRTAAAFEKGDPLRRVWSWLGSGVLAWAVGAVLYALYQAANGGAEPPYPWYSDIGYLLMVPLVTFGMYTLQDSQPQETPAWGILGGAATFIVTLFICFSASEKALEEAQNTLEYHVEVAYIVLDPALLGMSVMVASLFAARADALPWWYTLGGLVLYFFGNIGFTIQTTNDLYVTGGLIDLTWPLAFGLIALSATTTFSMSRPVERAPIPLFCSEITTRNPGARRD